LYLLDFRASLSPDILYYIGSVLCRFEMPMTSKFRALATFLLFGYVVVLFPQGNSRATLEQILTNQVIWGRDFPTALAYVTAWENVGEHKVAIFEDRVQGTTRISNSLEARLSEEQLRTAIQSTSRTTHDNVRALMSSDKSGTQTFSLDDFRSSAQSVEEIQEDGGTVLAATSKELQFLSPSATIRLVEMQLGSPEKVTTQVLRGSYERRPVILTQYGYASGQVSFVTSNMNPDDRIERVYLDAAAVSKSISAARRN